MSLEDIFPMVIAIIIIFVFIAFIFSIVGDILTQRQTEEMHSTALGISRIVVSKSVFVYGGNEGLFDSGKLDEYAFKYEDLVSLYGVAGRNLSLTVRDLEDTNRKWEYTPNSESDNSVTIALPIAIRYSVDVVHAGLLEVKVWKEK
jgi:hypothetical protein